jgi:hypothetical protein
MKKKLGLYFVIIFLAVIAAIFLPWDRLSSLKDKLLGVGESYSLLKVYSLGGDMHVYVDDEDKGVVQEQDSYLEVFPITSGEHEVKLVREASTDGFYKEFVRRINFEKGFDTVIGWEIGPTEESSSGWILYAQESSVLKGGVTRINLNCKPSDCNVDINDEDSLTAPISQMEISLDKQYTFKASKEGFQDLEFQALPEDQEARAKLEGYELFFDVNLYRIPI